MPSYFIFCLLLSGLCMFIMIAMPYKACTSIERDIVLGNYRYEMNNERNDGWLKKYYFEKYQERLNQLLSEKGISRFWWNIYKFSSKQKFQAEV